MSQGVGWWAWVNIAILCHWVFVGGHGLILLYYVAGCWLVGGHGMVLLNYVPGCWLVGIVWYC